jgi:hypothetical protein
MASKKSQNNTLENIIAPLAEGVKQITNFQTSAQIMNERRDNPELRTNWFYTNNFAMYTVENGKEILYFGTENNPILKNIDDACSQLINNDNYHVNKEDKKAVIDSAKSGNILRINMSDLRLKGNDSEWKYIEINTSNYERILNSSERAFAEAVYGKGNDFTENMSMLSKKGIETTKIYVLDENYVTEHAKNGTAIARACWLGYFYDNSLFYASDRVVYDSKALRGVRLVAEGDGGEKLVQLPEAGLHDVLGNYFAPALLDKVMKEITSLYQ